MYLCLQTLPHHHTSCQLAPPPALPCSALVLTGHAGEGGEVEGERGISGDVGLHAETVLAALVGTGLGLEGGGGAALARVSNCASMAGGAASGVVDQESGAEAGQAEAHPAGKGDPSLFSGRQGRKLELLASQRALCCALVGGKPAVVAPLALPAELSRAGRADSLRADTR